MASCDILDFRCIFVSELFGNTALAVIGIFVFYFIIASKLRFGFDTTIAFGVPILLVISLTFAGFSIIFAFLTVIAGILLAYLFQRMIGNR